MERKEDRVGSLAVCLCLPLQGGGSLVPELCIQLLVVGSRAAESRAQPTL